MNSLSFPDFSPIQPFGTDAPLDKAVLSDHCEVMITTSNGRRINAWNISNPAYHKYFKKDPGLTFSNTHLAVDVPYLEGVLETSLAEKIESQQHTISARLLSSQVGVQVIIEGYHSFYEELAKMLSQDKDRFYLVCDKIKDSPTKNATGIVIDTKQFHVLDSGVLNRSYTDRENGESISTLKLPYAQLRDKETEQSLLIVGVHVPGTKSQYPASGLAELAKQIDDLFKKNSCDLIAIGDFNTPPSHAKIHLVHDLLLPDYFTHANPLSQAVQYDYACVISSNATNMGYHTEPIVATSASSQALAEGLAYHLI